jgi:hypothetical protein
VICDEF